MARKAALERRLAEIEPFADPRVDLEQYATPPDIAAHVVHTMDLQGDLRDRTVIDLGTGPGVLALGASLRAPRRVIGVEIDGNALAIARRNERRVDPPIPVAWIRADARRPPLRHLPDATAVMNPPFGAQAGNVHADRAFLAAASAIADVSYSFHNAGSRAFVESFAADRNGTITAAMRVSFDLAYQFAFHDEAVRTIEAELFRIVWAQS